MLIETKVVIGWFQLQLKMWLVELNYNFECDWLIELSDNKLSDNKLSDNKLSDNNLTSELVENRSFFKPITIEEIVIFMIRRVYNIELHIARERNKLTTHFKKWEKLVAVMNT